MQLDAPNPVAQVNQRRARIAPHHPVRALEVRNPRMTLGLRNRLLSSRCRIETLRPIRANTTTRQPRRRAIPQRARSPAIPSDFMRATVQRTPAASHISNGPSSQLNPACIASSIDGASRYTSPMRSAA